MNEPNAVRNIRVQQTKPTNTLNDSNGNLNVKFFGVSVLLMSILRNVRQL